MLFVYFAAYSSSCASMPFRTPSGTSFACFQITCRSRDARSCLRVRPPAHLQVRVRAALVLLDAVVRDEHLRDLLRVLLVEVRVAARVSVVAYISVLCIASNVDTMSLTITASWGFYALSRRSSLTLISGKKRESFLRSYRSLTPLSVFISRFFI